MIAFENKNLKPRIISQAKPKPYCPARHKLAIYNHLVMNYSGTPAEVIQLWYSKPGYGKTFCIRGILLALKVEVISFDARDAEDAEANVPLRRLNQAYGEVEAAVRGLDGDRRPAVLLIEDVDLLLGHRSLMQTTINTQLLTSYLMSLCDRAYMQTKTNRLPFAPIIMTSNQPEVLHAPLIRDGRASVKLWDILPDEKNIIVGRIFPELTPKDVNRLVEAYKDFSIAFFAAIKRRYEEDANRIAISEVTPQEAIQLALEGKWNIPSMFAASLQELLQIAKKIALGHQARALNILEE